jgi:hypothetical protein
MPVTFYAENEQRRTRSAYLRLPAVRAGSLLLALDYPAHDLANPQQLLPADVLDRIMILRRQVALGHGREFTSIDLDEAQLLWSLEELETVARRAQEGSAKIVLLST